MKNLSKLSAFLFLKLPFYFKLFVFIELIFYLFQPQIARAGSYTNKRFICEEIFLPKKSYSVDQKHNGDDPLAEKILDYLLDKNGQINPDYKDKEGLIKLTSLLKLRNLKLAFIIATKNLDRKTFRSLNWRYFDGSIEDLNKWESLLYDTNGSPRPEYFQQDGYLKFSNDHCGDNLDIAYGNTLFAIGKTKTDQLGWDRFRGTIDQYHNWRNLLFDESGNPKSEYIHTAGQILFSNTFTDGRMEQAFSNTSLRLTPDEFRLFKWKRFTRSTSDFATWRSLLKDKNGKPKKKYYGQRGYMRFADENTDRKMWETFINASAVLSEKELKEQEWIFFPGTTNQMRSFRAIVLNSDGLPNPEFSTQRGQIRFSERYTGGKMLYAFVYIESILTSDEFKLLEWRKVLGMSSYYQQIRDSILGPDNKPMKQYVYQTGLNIYAYENKFKGNILAAFKEVQRSLTHEEFEELGWRYFFANSAYFRLIREHILGPQENSPNNIYYGTYGFYESVRTFEQKHNPNFRNPHSIYLLMINSLDPDELVQMGWDISLIPKDD